MKEPQEKKEDSLISRCYVGLADVALPLVSGHSTCVQMTPWMTGEPGGGQNF